MENDHILGIIDYALATTVEISDQVDVRSRSTRTVEPSLTERYGLAQICFLILDQKYLRRRSAIDGRYVG